MTTVFPSWLWRLSRATRSVCADRKEKAHDPLPWNLSRTVLRGLGTAVALPLLEAMESSAAWAAGPEAASPPRRMAFLFIPNGVNLAEWTPQTVGFDYDLPFILQPLRRVKDEVLVLSGLTHDKGRANDDGPGDHAAGGGVVSHRMPAAQDRSARTFAWVSPPTRLPRGKSATRPGFPRWNWAAREVATWAIAIRATAAPTHTISRGLPPAPPWPRRRIRASCSSGSSRDRSRPRTKRVWLTGLVCKRACWTT